MKLQIGTFYLDGERESYFKILGHVSIEGINKEVVAEIRNGKLMRMPYMIDDHQLLSMTILNNDLLKISLTEEELSESQMKIRNKRHKSILAILSNY